MWRAFRSEWIKIRRRAILISALAMCALTGFFVYLGIVRVTTSTRREAQLQLLVLKTDVGLAALLARVGELILVISLIVVAASVAAEYGQGTLRNLLVREPGRLRLLGGKYLALLIYSEIVATLALVVACGVAFAVSPGHGVDTSPWLTSNGVSNVLGFWSNLLLAVFAWTTLGMLTAILFRSAAAAIGVALAYILPIEALLPQVWTDAPQWLFGSLTRVIMAGGNAQLVGGTSPADYNRALELVGLYVLVGLGVVATLFRRRDVSA